MTYRLIACSSINCPDVHFIGLFREDAQRSAADRLAELNALNAGGAGGDFQPWKLCGTSATAYPTEGDAQAALGVAHNAFVNAQATPVSGYKNAFKATSALNPLNFI